MNSTRLTSSLAFAALVVGLVALVRGDSLFFDLLGAGLVAGAALMLSRHFWREGERRTKRESARVTAEITLLQTNITKRVNVFTRGVLEHVAQLQIDVEEQAQILDEAHSSVADLRDESASKADIGRRLELTERRLTRATDDAVRQLSGISAVYSILDPAVPYPEFGGWAISGDCAQLLVSRVLTSKPRFVLEAGSGLSTILVAQTLEIVGEGGVIVTLEHDKSWMEHTRGLLDDHGIGSNVRLHHAPLIDTSIGEETFRWYDLTEVELPGRLDLVFVDGPPKATGHIARYPALPLLHERLADNGMLLMDDASRPEEREAIDRWHAEFPDLSITFHKNTKGTAEIRKGSR